MDSDGSDDSSNAQLSAELQSHAEQGLFDVRATRPVLKHLNADSSWLLSLPYPKHLQPPPGRCRYNIVIDPWLRGKQVDFHRWFSSQEHAEQSCIQSLHDLNALLRGAESAISRDLLSSEAYYIDAICCSHEFTDHCHEATLKELPQAVPIFAARKAANLIRSWDYFEKVFEIPEYESIKEENHDHVPIQPWINVRRVCTKGDGPAYLHSALLITFTLDNNVASEAVIYTPHGIATESLKPALIPRHRVLALLHGLHDISLAGSQLNLGKENALRISKDLEVAYWLPTHDEVKVAHGLVAYLLKRISHTLEIAPGSHPILDEAHVPEPNSDRYYGIGNGGTLILR